VINILTGKGEQRILTNKFEAKRKRGLLDKDNIDEELHEWYQIEGADGGGITNPDTFIRKQPRWSTSSPKKIDTRTLPQIGD